MTVYSPSPEYPVDCCRDDLPSLKLWHDTDGGANRVEAGLASAQFRFDTPQHTQRRRLRRVCCGELHLNRLFSGIICVISSGSPK